MYVCLLFSIAIIIGVSRMLSISLCALLSLAVQTKLTFANPIAVMDIACLERTRSLQQLNVCRTARLCRRRALH